MNAAYTGGTCNLHLKVVKEVLGDDTGNRRESHEVRKPIVKLSDRLSMYNDL